MSILQTLSQEFVSPANSEFMVSWLSPLSHGHSLPIITVSKYCTYVIAPLADLRTKLKSSDVY